MVGRRQQLCDFEIARLEGSLPRSPPLVTSPGDDGGDDTDDDYDDAWLEGSLARSPPLQWSGGDIGNLTW